MKLFLDKNCYKGVDGSSLSEMRCLQILSVYEMLEDIGSPTITYIQLQEIAEEKNLFGETKAKSAIRTIFPLLAKLGFVNYEYPFPANKCFTELGRKFVLSVRILNNLNDNTPNKEEILVKTNSIKENCIVLGLINFYHLEECQDNNIWIALRLLKKFEMIHWNYFLYAIYYLYEGKALEDIIADIRNDEFRVKEIEFLNSDGDVLPNTCYSYIRALLTEAGMIEAVSKSESKLTKNAYNFFNIINFN